MKVYYDLHIHSALSPCAEAEMTPNNIVNMSLLKGLDMIAVTDHNSCGNIRAVMEVAEGSGLLVVPGMELETEEEVHVVCYFPDIDSAEFVWSEVRKRMNGIANRPDIFGNQYYMDSEDNIIGEEKQLLVTPAAISLAHAFELVDGAGGIAVPAHIDRSSYSVISNLGFIPPEINATVVEITAKNRERLAETYRKYNILTNSDAHNLGDISEKEYCLEMLHKNIGNFLQML